MIAFLIKLLIFCTFNFDNVQSVLFPSKQNIPIVKNEGFLVHLVHPIKFNLHKCSVKLEDGTSFDLDPLVQEPLIYNTSDGVIQRFSQKFCGVRVKNVGAPLAGNWTLIAESDRQVVDSDWFMLEVLPNKLDQSPRVIKVTEDSPYKYTSCPNSKVVSYCRIIGPNGETTAPQNDCDVSVTAIGNETFYDCRTMRYGRMREMKSAIKVVKEETKPVTFKGVITETDTHFILTCRDTLNKDFCRAEMPGVEKGKKKQFLISEGLLMDHYSTYDTEFSKGRCSLEIEKPLRPEDIGMWRFYHGKKTETGCVFRLEDNSPIPQSNANDPKKTEHWKKRMYSNLIIECEVPYEIDYCYLSTPDFPNNENFTSLKPKEFFRSKSLGICRFDIPEPLSGLYVCGVNSIYGGEDIQTYYQVKVYEVPVKTSSSFVQGGKGQLIDMMVKTIFDLPITYCRFMMPNGQIHGVSERFNMSGPIKYYGKGLQYGECGIQILRIKDDDFGLWKATFQIGNDEYTVDMVLTKHGGFSAAYVAGPILAVVLIGGIVLGYVAYQKHATRRRRRRYDRTVATTTDDLDLDNRSEASHES